jgi:hypothetical protein
MKAELKLMSVRKRVRTALESDGSLWAGTREELRSILATLDSED